MNATLAVVRPAVRRAAIPLAGTIGALLLGLVLITAAGASLSGALYALWQGMVGTPYALGTSLNAIAILGLVGGGFVVAARAGLTNVGGEGQINLGGLGGAAIALHGAADLPGPLPVLVALVVGAVAGAAWGALAGALKAWRGTSEVISTLLLNFVGIGLVSLAVHEQGLLRQPATSAATLPNSPPVPASTQLPLLGLGEGSPGSIAILVAIVVLVGVAVVLRRSAFGLRMRAVALGPEAARRCGIGVRRTEICALVVSGGCGGLAGATLVLGVPYVLQDGFSSGYGFEGLVVGLLARGSTAGLALAAVLFGLLRTGGIALEVGLSVPTSVVLIVQAIIAVVLATTAGGTLARTFAARGATA